MELIVGRFAEALKWIDSSREQYRNFQPGVGPYGEPQVVKKAVEYLRKTHPVEFRGARTKREPDVLIPGRWALEFKIVLRGEQIQFKITQEEIEITVGDIKRISIPAVVAGKELTIKSGKTYSIEY